MVLTSRQRPWTKDEIERLWRVAQEKDLKFDSRAREPFFAWNLGPRGTYWCCCSALTAEWVDIEMDFKRSNRALQLKFADLKKKRKP